MGELGTEGAVGQIGPRALTNDINVKGVIGCDWWIAELRSPYHTLVLSGEGPVRQSIWKPGLGRLEEWEAPPGLRLDEVGGSYLQSTYWGSGALGRVIRIHCGSI